MTFSISGTNSGMIVSSDHYLESSNTSNIGGSIVDSALSNDDYGFSVVDTVEMMVASKMGASIASIQAQITNANIQQGALSQFQTTMDLLSKNTISLLNQRNALTSFEISNSNTNAIATEISSNGLTGNIDLSIGVDQLATSQSLTVNGFSSANDILEAGTLTFEFGSYTTGIFAENTSSTSLYVEINDGMTLAELASEINSSTTDLKATIVTQSDGSVKLAIISQKTGSENELKISSDGAASLSTFEYSGADTTTVTEARAAVDAIYTLNGVEMKSSTNSISDVFGLNLTLTSVTTNDVNISATSSPEGVVDNLYAFVENYNALIELYNSYNASTPAEDFVGSIYNSNIAETIEDELDKLFRSIIVSGNSLSDIGITRSSSGTLSLDEDTLVTALEKDPNLAYNLLGSKSTSSNTGVVITDIGESTDGAHELIITRNAEKSVLNGAALNTTTSLTTDLTFSATFGKSEIEITIPAGDYSQQEIVQKLNLQISAGGITDYKAYLEDGAISFKSIGYGSLKTIELSTDVNEIGLSASTVYGVDVAGTINGNAFLGDGTEAEIKFDDATMGMKFTVDPESVSINETIQLETATGFLDNLSTKFELISSEITSSIEDIQDDLDSTLSSSLIAQLESLESKEEYYYNLYYQQFSGVSATLAQMESTIELMTLMFDSDD